MKNTMSSSFKQAKELKLQADGLTLKDRVGGTNQNDFFRFKLKNRSSFDLDLKSFGGKTDTMLIKDLNGNGRVDRNEIIGSTSGKSSTFTNNASKSINCDSLEAGTYFIRVFSQKRGDAKYSLTLSTTSLSNNNSNSNSNDNLNNATDGGVSDPPPVSSVAPLPKFVADVLRFTNDFRLQNNLQPLVYNDRLSTAAFTQSQNMAVQDFFAHEGLDGSTPQTRGTTAGYQGGVGENIAAGFTTPRSVVDAWINSPGHRANLLNPSYKDIGIGFYDYPNDTGKSNYNYYWTQDFGIPA
jgi:uncharacterized protein YkwD